MIQAVLFDLFETLVTERERGAMPGPTVAERLGLDAEVYKTEWRKRQQARLTGVLPDYASAVRDMCTELGCEMSQDAIRQMESERIASFAVAYARPNAAMVNAIREIKSLGVSTGLISNASPDEIVAYDRCWLSELMDMAVFSCEVGWMKPGPEIYLTACEGLGVGPGECVYVGDGGFGELPGAAALGMTVYCATWYRDRGPDASSAPYPKLADASDLLAAVRRAM
jgi:HAD superfamily hydrolase (TIGR01509 family)